MCRLSSTHVWRLERFHGDCHRQLIKTVNGVSYDVLEVNIGSNIHLWDIILGSSFLCMVRRPESIGAYCSDCHIHSFFF